MYRPDVSTRWCGGVQGCSEAIVLPMLGLSVSLDGEEDAVCGVDSPFTSAVAFTRFRCVAVGCLHRAYLSALPDSVVLALCRAFSVTVCLSRGV
jgi:hypothetical protein